MSYKELSIPRKAESKNKLVIVSGPQGGGKDYLLSKAVNEGAIPSNVSVLSYGDEMTEFLIEKELITERDQIPTLHADHITEAQMRAAEKIAQRQPAMVTSHVVFCAKEIIGVNPTNDERLNAAHYLFVWASPQDIEKRRRKDTQRNRPVESQQRIKLHQDLAMVMTATLADNLGAGFSSLWNREDNVEENVEKIGELAAALVYR